MPINDLNTWNPMLHIEVLRGGYVGDELLKRTISFTYIDRARKFDEVEWVLDNHDGYCTKIENIALGLVLRLRLGYLGAMIPPQTFIINKIAGGVGVNRDQRMSVADADAKITYHGRNRNAPGNLAGKGKIKKGMHAGPTQDITQHDLFLGSSSREKGGPRIFHVKCMSDAVKEIASRNGFYGPYAMVQDTTDRVDNVVIPGTMSDGEFLMLQADRYGYTYKIDHRGLHWHDDGWGKKTLKRPVERLVYGVSGDIETLRVVGDFKLPVPLNVKAHGRDHQTREGFVAQLDAANSKVKTAFTSFYMTGLPSPNQPNARSAPGARERMQALSRQESFITPETRQVASVEATNRFIKRHLGALKLEITCAGNPKLLATYMVLVGGTYTRLVDGIWWIDEAKHVFDGTTYKTSITVKQPPPKAKPGAVTEGMVWDDKFAHAGGKPIVSSILIKNLDR